MEPKKSILEQVSLIVALPISPRRLPLASRTASTALSSAAAVIVVTTEGLFLMAVPMASGSRWPNVSSYVAHIGQTAVSALPWAIAVCALPILILAAFIYFFDSDEAPILRSILLSPLPLLLPAAVWGVCHVFTTLGTSVLRSPGWSAFPLFRMLGALWLLPVFALAAYGLILWSARVSMRIKHDPTLCRACGYSLRGLDSDRCPECGTPFDKKRIQANIERFDAIENRPSE